MTIIEALRRSKETGRTYARPKSGGGFCRYVANFTYELKVDDLLADDWECLASGLPNATEES